MSRFLHSLVFLLVVFSLYAWDPDLSLAAPGGLVLVGAGEGEQLIRGELRSDDRAVSSGDSFYDGSSGRSVILLPIPCDFMESGAEINIQTSTGSESRFISLKSREYIRETIPLNGAMSNLRSSDDPRKAEESRILWQILCGFDAASSVSGSSFLLPVGAARESSHYGDRRIFRYQDGTESRALHLGIDYAVPIGTPVAAPAADGKVILKADRMLTGHTLVIEHGPGIFTLYYHLDSIGVAEGARVRRGDTVARSGMSGLATGGTSALGDAY